MNKTLVVRQESALVQRWFDAKIWFQWILTNVIGLGITALTGVIFVLFLAKGLRAQSSFVMAVLMILAGAFGGFAVGTAQAKILGKTLATFYVRGWIIATTIGAVGAWILGMMPSLLMSFNEKISNSQPAEIGEMTTGLSAAFLGFALGIVLGFPQWIELRRYVNGAGWWILANALAWTIGVPQLLAVPGMIREGLPAWQSIFVLFATVISVGASVGAIHGFFLVWLLKSKDKESWG